MKVKEVRATYGFTLNLGNYDSGRVEAGVTVDVEPGESAEEAFAKAFKVTLTQVTEHMAKLEELAKWKTAQSKQGRST